MPGVPVVFQVTAVSLVCPYSVLSWVSLVSLVSREPLVFCTPSLDEQPYGGGPVYEPGW